MVNNMIVATFMRVPFNSAMRERANEALEDARVMVR